MRRYETLAIGNPDGLCFGVATEPLTCGFGLRIGAGRVYPELNFTLPTMLIEEATWTSVRQHYEEIGAMIHRAAARLQLDGLMVEFELLPPMTERAAWGGEITRILHEALKSAHNALGLPCALRVTPTDIRDKRRPPLLRSGEEWDMLVASFEECAREGADVLSIESVGGKEVHDEALMYGDVAGILFALGSLAPRDMEFLWRMVVDLCAAQNVIPGGDSACGFANTAMQLASQGMLPEVLAAVVRAASAVRSLVAYEMGARGPSKDCAYEGPVLKAITGTTISMEGKSATCAHFSPVGNIAAAACDLWSNESVQNVRLLSGNAPEAYLELLAYDCRLFNTAVASRTEKVLRSLLVASDVGRSPQALILSPESSIRVARAIVGAADHYHGTLAAARCAVDIIAEAHAARRTELNAREEQWLNRIRQELDGLPDKEETLLGRMVDAYGHLFTPSSYGLT